MTPRSSAISKTMAILVAVVVLASVSFGIYGFTRTPTVTTSYVTSSTTYTSTIYGSPANTFVTNTTTIYTASTVQNPCSQQFANGISLFSAPKVFAPQNSSVMICTRLYYYNYTSTKSFNTSSLLNVGVGNTGSQPSEMDFGVTAFPSEVSIGGASNVSEGTLVLYTITTGNTSNGTYVINLLAALYPSLEICGQFAQLIVSNPNPFYGYNPSCTTPVQGFLSVEVIGISNSTVNVS